MPSLPANLKPHCKATFPLHPRSFINTVQDQPVFSAHSSVKSYVSCHLASTPAFIRGRRGGSREEAPEQPANFTAQAIAALRVVKRLAPSWCDASRYHSPRGWACGMPSSGAGSLQMWSLRKRKCSQAEGQWTDLSQISGEQETASKCPGTCLVPEAGYLEFHL